MEVYNSSSYNFMGHYAEIQNEMRWSYRDYQMISDKQSWIDSNTDVKNFILGILSYFVHSDVEVCDNYAIKYPLFFNNLSSPELASFFLAVGNTEGIHFRAYAFLLDTLNLEQSVYSLFKESDKEVHRLTNIETIKADLSLENILSTDKSTRIKVFKHCVKLVLFLEGVLLYGMFALLLSFSFDGMFPGVAGIVTWSIRDENLHVEAMSQFMRYYAKKELDYDVSAMEEELIEYSEKILEIEQNWLNLISKQINIANLPPTVRENFGKTMDYLRYLSSCRISFFLKKKVNQDNPLPFMDFNTDYRHVDFLKERSSEYNHPDFTKSDLFAEIDKLYPKE